MPYLVNNYFIRIRFIFDLLNLFGMVLEITQSEREQPRQIRLGPVAPTYDRLVADAEKFGQIRGT